jgi:hypothetical protein
MTRPTLLLVALSLVLLHAASATAQAAAAADTASTAAMAATASGETNAPGEENAPDESSAPGDTSAAARSGKSWLVSARVGDFIGGISGAGVELARVHDPALQYGVLLMTGGRDLRDRVDDNDAVELERFEATGQLALARVRWFPGNNFHVGGGIGVRRIAFQIDVADRLDAGHATTEAQATSIVLAAAVGNQWSWGNGFVLGADWLGYAVPLTSAYSSSVKTDGSATDDLDELSRVVDDSARRLGTVPSSMLLVVELGYLF